MIILKKPAANFLYTSFNMYGYFLYSPTDPNLTSKEYATRLFYPKNVVPGSASSFTPTGLPFNITTLAGRNSFLNNISFQITTNTSTLGPSMVVTNANTLFYGTDPVTGLILFEWEVFGTMAENVPRPIIIIQEYILSPTFTYEIPNGQNAATITYS
jgi:hypothetical protein